ncbi:MAG: plasmid pRiA4b ORF-3 family protein [Phormidesmis sp.]
MQILSSHACQLRIVLADSEPQIWRRILVPADVTLSQLHEILQQVMGWQNLHDYVFQLGSGAAKSPCNPQALLREVGAIAIDQPIYYSYDSHSGWLHRIDIETTDIETVADATREPLPVCVGGALACPPEGSGGVWGYEELLIRLEDSEDPEYIDLIEKYGDFDPYAFEVAQVNARLEKETFSQQAD